MITLFTSFATALVATAVTILVRRTTKYESRTSLEAVACSIVLACLYEPLLFWFLGRQGFQLFPALGNIYLIAFILVCIFGAGLLGLNWQKYYSPSKVLYFGSVSRWAKLPILFAPPVYLIFWNVVSDDLPLFAWDALTAWGLMAKEFYLWNDIQEFRNIYSLVYGQNTALFPIFLGKSSALQLSYNEIAPSSFVLQALIVHTATYIFCVSFILERGISMSISILLPLVLFTTPLLENQLLIFGYPEVVVFDVLIFLFLWTYRSNLNGQAPKFFIFSSMAILGVLIKIHVAWPVLITSLSVFSSSRYFRGRLLAFTFLMLLTISCVFVLDRFGVTQIRLTNVFQGVLDHWELVGVFIFNIANFDISRFVIAFFANQSFGILWVALMVLSSGLCCSGIGWGKARLPKTGFAIFYIATVMLYMTISDYYLVHGAVGADTSLSRHCLYLLPALLVLVIDILSKTDEP